MNSQPEIWIVDDERSIRWVLEKALTQEAFRVRSFENGDLMLAALPHANPDIIISDIRMPGMDGLRMISILRQEDDFQKVPVLIVTTESSSEQKNHAKELGVIAWIQKPISGRALVKTLNKLL